MTRSVLYTLFRVPIVHMQFESRSRNRFVADFALYFWRVHVRLMRFEPRDRRKKFSTVLTFESIVFFVSANDMKPQILCTFLIYEANRAAVFIFSFFVHLSNMGLQERFSAVNSIAKFAFVFFVSPHGFPLVLVPESRIIILVASIAVNVAIFF